MKLRQLPTLCAALLALCPILASAQTSAVPGFISYQGRVVDASGANVGAGTPVNRTVIFRIWDNPSSTNVANLIYSEAQTVTVSEGEFSVLVGQGVVNPTQTYGYVETTKKLADIGLAFGGSTRYLGVTVAATASIVTTDNEITPRQQIVSTAFAMRAKYAEQVGSNGIAALTALDSGRVGIGTLAPPALFTVSGANVSTTTTTPQLLVTADDLTERLRIGVDSTNNGTGFIQAFKEGIGGQNLLLNPNGGNVGIGIGNTNPAVALSVTGAITATGAITGGSITTAAGSLTTNTGNIGIGTTAPVARLEIIDGTTSGTWGSMVISRPTNGHTGSHLAFVRTAVTAMGLGYAPSSNVFGFGQGTSGTFSPGALSIDANNWNVGIGTAAPGFPLNMSNALGDKIALYGNSGAHFGFGVQNNQLQIHTDTNAADVVFGYGTSAAMTETMRIKGNGNVGIGKSLPLYPLDVAGAARVSGQLNLDSHILMGSGQVIYAKNTSGGIEPTFWPREANGTYINYGTAGFFIRNNASTNTMTMSNDGIVTIGAPSSSQARLNVGSRTSTWTSYGRLTDNGANQDNATYTGLNLSIYADGHVLANQFDVASDLRIKKVLQVSNGAADLEALLGIEITDYRMRDSVNNSRAIQKKVIAQQVETVYPQAVTKGKGEIPDIYKNASVRDGWVEIDTDLKTGELVKLIYPKGESVVAVLEVKPGAFRPDLELEGDKVFVYGRQVEDFRRVDYDAISMLNVSATQQLKREKDAEIQGLARQLKTVQDENAALRRELAAKDEKFEERLITLERSLSNRNSVKTVSLKTAKTAE